MAIRFVGLVWEANSHSLIQDWSKIWPGAHTHIKRTQGIPLIAERSQLISFKTMQHITPIPIVEPIAMKDKSSLFVGA